MSGGTTVGAASQHEPAVLEAVGEHLPPESRARGYHHLLSPAPNEGWKLHAQLLQVCGK